MMIGLAFASTTITNTQITSTGNVTANWFFGNIDWDDIQNVPSGLGTDTNATTACGTNEVLDGDGDCVDHTQWLTSYTETDPKFSAENSSLWAEARNKYNVTYATWAYNQTTAVFNLPILNNTYALIGSGGNASWNESRANDLYASVIWGYNQTTATYNLYGINWYNHTLAVEGLYSKWFYNQTAPAINYLETLYGANWYNHTTEAIDYIDAQGFITSGITNNTLGWNVSFTNIDENLIYNHTLALLGLINEEQIYNHTLATEGLYGKWFYNQSEYPISYLNQTYGKFWYNQTNGANFANIYNHTQYLLTNYGSQWYNHTLSLLGMINEEQIYNHTSAVETLYNKWFYNQTTPAITYLNTTYGKFWYNMTTESMGGDFSFTDFQDSYDLNSTPYSPNWYNHSSALIGLYGNLWYNYSLVAPAPTSTYNETYATWLPNRTLYSPLWYNHTTEAIDYVDAQGFITSGIENNTYGWNLTMSNIRSIDWTNVTITESQILDFGTYGDFSFSDFQDSWTSNSTAYALYWYNHTTIANTYTDTALGNYVPYTGATDDVDLGGFNITSSKHCLNSGCTSYIENNGTSTIIA